MKINKFMKAPERPAPEQQLRDVANMYEKHFLREMTKAMRSTVQESGFIQTNHAEKIFREQLDDQYVEKWNDRGGIGLSDMIFDQLVEKFGAQLGLKAPIQKPQGPLQVSLRDQASGGFHARQAGSNKMTIEYEIPKLQSATDGRLQVRTPWDGVLSKKVELRPDEHLLEISHRNGLKSQILYQGRASQIEIGKELQEGASLGLANPDGQRLIWNLSRDLTETRPQTQETVSE